MSAMSRKAYATAIALCVMSSPSLSQEALKWGKVSSLDRYSQSYVKLDEEESIKDVVVATARLREKTPEAETDALFIYHQSQYFCGTAGCSLEILLRMPDGTMSKVADILVNDVSLGRLYTKGLRNLRMDNAVTWVWTGRTYDIK
jgi:hypothetical protein